MKRVLKKVRRMNMEKSEYQDDYYYEIRKYGNKTIVKIIKTRNRSHFPSVILTLANKETIKPINNNAAYPHT